MLKKIVKIEGIGRLRSCHPHGDVEFRRATLIYADNAAGKTTLCEVLRSVTNGDATHIRGRKTLGRAEPPLVELRTDAGLLSYRDGAWTAPLPDIAVFDERYVHENVFAGEAIAHDQKKGLYRVIVGPVGVRLAREIEALDLKIRSITRDLLAEERRVLEVKPESTTLDAFITMPVVQDIDQKIAGAAKQVELEDRVDEVLRAPAPLEIEIAEAPEIAAVLGASLENVARDAESRLRAHMVNCQAEADEDWLHRGVEIVSDHNACPFCGATLRGNDLIAAYRSYFSDEYATLKDRIRETQVVASGFYSEHDFQRLQGRIERDNAVAFEYWGKLTPLTVPKFDMTTFRDAANALRVEVGRLLAAKARDPLTPVALDAPYESAVSMYQSCRDAAAAYNEAVAFTASAVAAKKKEVQTSAAAHTSRSLLASLHASKLRHTPEVSKRCVEVIRLRLAKAEADVEKARLRARLDEHTDGVFADCEADVNKILERFGARFRVGNTRKQHVGGTPSAEFELVIEGESVDLGTSTTPLDQPSFRNTLSSGDKSSLALALFLVQMMRDPDLARRIVVLDDPFTSQDSGRRGFTIQKIATLAREAGQIVVMSHDRFFLRELLDDLCDVETKLLQIAHFPQRCLIEEYDLQKACLAQGIKDHHDLLAFVERGEGDPESIRQRLRPFMEDYLYVKLPDQFPDNTTLGEMIGAIRAAASEDPLGAAKPLIEDLTAINELSLGRQHRVRIQGNDERGDGEIKTHAAIALGIVRGFELRS